MKDLKIKICGIKNLSTALLCIDEGVNYLGFNFSPKSKRQISFKDAEIILNSISKQTHKVKNVALFYKNNMDEVNEIMNSKLFDYLQYVVHDESFERLKNDNIKYIPQIGVSDELFENDLNYDDDLIILDSFQKEKGGGSGKIFPWSRVKSIRRNYLLAGGLNPDNVSEAIEVLQPYGVDVASGVENENGEKDLLKIKRFITNARR